MPRIYRDFSGFVVVSVVHIAQISANFVIRSPIKSRNNHLILVLVTVLTKDINLQCQSQ